VEDGSREWKVRAGAIPIAVVAALFFHSCETGHFVQRSALTMPLHELGHAITAWWCGYAAIPSLWKTAIPETRGMVLPLIIAALEAAMIWRGWTTDRMWLAGVGFGLAVLQFACMTMISDETASLVITFGGDAGAMILGTGLMLLFFVGGPDSKWRTGGLRIGFLCIGAAALVDTLATWWTARTDHDAIPYGEIEGVSLSDPSKLDELHGWTATQIVDRYVMVGTICIVLLVAVWAYATSRSKRGLST
jgi:hypothetical protein